MRLLLTVASFEPRYGGPAASVSQLARALVGQGCEVGVWAPDRSATRSILLQDDAQLARLDGRLQDALAFLGHDGLAHDNGIWLPHNHSLSEVARRREIRRVVSVRGMLRPWALAHKRWKKAVAWTAYQRRDLRRASGLHATSAEEAEGLASLRLGPPILTAPNGVELPDLAAPPAGRDVRIALFLGRLYPVKGLPLLLEAWAQERPKGWRLHIAGPDEAGHLAELTAIVRALGLEPVVDFLGPVTGAAKTELYQNADLFVLPSHSESFGMAVGEALAHGLPVLTTSAVPWPDLEKEACGWRVEVSSEALAESLRTACALDPPELQAMGRNGREYVGRTFSWAALAPRYLDFYRSLPSP